MQQPENVEPLVKNAKDAEPKAPTANNPDPKLREAIEGAFNTITDIDNQRAVLNAKKKEVIANLEKFGINLIAFHAAMKYRKMDPEKREGFDLSYAVARLSLGQPLQDDMFKANLMQEMNKFAKQNTH